MPNNFTNDAMMNDLELQKAIAACTDSESIKSTLKAYMQEKGMISLDRGDAATVHINQNPLDQHQHQPSRETSQQPSNGFKFHRDLKFGGVGGRRDLVLSANSEADLDALEAEILHYPKK